MTREEQIKILTDARDRAFKQIDLTEGCEIFGTVRNSVLGSGVKVMKGAAVIDSVIMENVVIGEDASVRYAIVDHDVCIGKNASIGLAREDAAGVSVIGAGIRIPDRYVIGDDQMIANQGDVKEEA